MRLCKTCNVPLPDGTLILDQCARCIIDQMDKEQRGQRLYEHLEDLLIFESPFGQKSNDYGGYTNQGSVGGAHTSFEELYDLFQRARGNRRQWCMLCGGRPATHFHRGGSVKLCIECEQMRLNWVQHAGARWEVFQVKCARGTRILDHTTGIEKGVDLCLKSELTPEVR